jgi:hypothetical protein
MAIKSSTFGRVELSGKDAARFVQQINENKDYPLAVAALARGREISEKISKGEVFKLKPKPDSDSPSQVSGSGFTRHF